MCKGQGTTKSVDSEKVVGGFFGHSAGIGRFSLENRPSGRNPSVFSRVCGLECQAYNPPGAVHHRPLNRDVKMMRDRYEAWHISDDSR